jgi:hypothetical protein
MGMADGRALDVSQPAPAGLAALYGPDAVPLALALTAQIALRRPVWVIDGGNRFDALWLAEYAARAGAAPESVLARINISRAFTCHQMAERILSLPEEAAPLVILHLLDTFYDENVPITEARRLLNALWPGLRRRSRSVPVALTLHPPSSARVADRECFYSGILCRADRRVGPDPDAFAPAELPAALPGFDSCGQTPRCARAGGGPPLQADPGTRKERDFRHPLPPLTDPVRADRPPLPPRLRHPSSLDDPNPLSPPSPRKKSVAPAPRSPFPRRGKGERGRGSGG